MRRIAELMPCNEEEPETVPQPGAAAGRCCCFLQLIVLLCLASLSISYGRLWAAKLCRLLFGGALHADHRFATLYENS